MIELLRNGLIALNLVLDAGNAITAFALLLYALTFNLRERVARSFGLLLACMTAVYFGDVLASTSTSSADIELWLRVQWVGISFLPATYLHLSDALLEATGRRSRGRRRAAVLVGYLAGGGFLAAAGLTPWLAPGLVQTGSIAYLRAGPLFYVYCLYLIPVFAITAINLARAYRRCLTRSSRRRMAYLTVGAVGPFVGTFPFLMLTGSLFAPFATALWAVLVPVNGAVAGSLVLMAYPVAYFGVSYPDRVVKSRIFQWIVRGPVVASTVLAVYVFTTRAGRLIGVENTRLVPLAMVAALLLLQYLITLVRPIVERYLFYGQDRSDILRLHLLEEHLLTSGDLKQFLESVLNAVCDVSRARSAFVALVGPSGLELEVSVGPDDPLRGSEELPTLVMSEDQYQIDHLGSVFRWDSYWLLPMRSPESTEIIGLLGIYTERDEPAFAEEEASDLAVLSERAAVALTDRLLQLEVFGAVDRLVPQAEALHQMRAAARYQGAQAFREPLEGVHSEADLVEYVRDALSHYWGGPRLTESPLLGLRVVRNAMTEHDGNPINALRHILRKGIERVRPTGERRFTTEWMLFNILEMKFLEGRKVRDVALRLAMSEADLYRKQKVAIEMVTQAIVVMEREAEDQAGRRNGSEA